MVMFLTEAECLDYWAEHLQQLPESPQGNDDLPNKPASNDYTDTCIQPVTKAEVAATLKAGRVTLTHWLVHNINEVWIREELPDLWRCWVILLSILGKLFTPIPLTKALPAICHKCRLQRTSFMPSCSRIDHISAVRPIAEKQKFV